MTARGPARRTPLTGLLLIVVGVLLLADNLDFLEIDFRHLFSLFWPLVFVLIGAGRIMDGRTRSGVGFLILGAVLQLAVLGWLDQWTVRRWWPAILIAFGLALVAQHYRGSRGSGPD